MHGDVGDLGESFCVPRKSFGGLRVVPGVVPDRLLGVRPVMSLLAVGHQRAGDGVRIMRFHQRTTFEAFDLHGFLLDDSIPYRPQLPGLPRSPDSVFAWLRPSNAMAVNSPLRSEIVPQALT